MGAVGLLDLGFKNKSTHEGRKKGFIEAGRHKILNGPTYELRYVDYSEKGPMQIVGRKTEATRDSLISKLCVAL